GRLRPPGQYRHVAEARRSREVLAQARRQHQAQDPAACRAQGRLFRGIVRQRPARRQLAAARRPAFRQRRRSALRQDGGRGRQDPDARRLRDALRAPGRFRRARNQFPGLQFLVRGGADRDRPQGRGAQVFRKAAGDPQSAWAAVGRLRPENRRAVGQLPADVFNGRPDQRRTWLVHEVERRGMSRPAANRPAASRLVVVSNRVAQPRETRAGGLAAAMRAALKEHGGLWFGWSGRRVAPNERALHRERAGNIDYALLDLTREEFETYYLGFANRTLWPLLHFQPTMMQYSRAQYAGYREVNKLFAEKIAPLLREDDRIWIHDYHLIPLASELRELGIGSRIGFFLHIPLPPPELLINLPCHADLIATLGACDLIGVQNRDDARALTHYFTSHLGAECSGD